MDFWRMKIGGGGSKGGKLFENAIFSNFCRLFDVRVTLWRSKAVGAWCGAIR
jgi:hypothetical protein